MNHLPAHEWTLAEWRAPAAPDGLSREPNHRMALLARQENIEIMILGMAGMQLKVIAGYVKMNPQTVYSRLQAMGIKITDYRKGKGPVAGLVFEKLANSIAKSGIQQLRERTDA